MISLERVATFLAVATHGGFREAARHTGLSQPTVTQHVKQLEQALDVHLIERNNAGSVLTPEGRTFLPYAENLVRACDRVKALFASSAVTIGASSNVGIYLLQPALKAFRDRYGHTLDVVIDDNVRIADKLENFEIDVAVMEWWDDRPGFVAHIWRREALVVIVPPQHPWAGMPSIPRDWLKGQNLLGGEAGTGTGRLLRRYLGDDAHTIGTALQLGSTEAVKRAVQAGLGISLVLASAVELEHRNGLLRALPLEGVAPHKDIYLIRRKGRRPGTPAVQFTDFLAGIHSAA